MLVIADQPSVTDLENLLQCLEQVSVQHLLGFRENPGG